MYRQLLGLLQESQPGGRLFSPHPTCANSRLHPRAAVVNGNVQAGHTVLITGIGGGVALTAMQLCLAIGASVYVTSGHLEKIHKAVQAGAKGGVNYKNGRLVSLSLALGIIQITSPQQIGPPNLLLVSIIISWMW